MSGVNQVLIAHVLDGDKIKFSFTTTYALNFYYGQHCTQISLPPESEDEWFILIESHKGTPGHKELINFLSRELFTPGLNGTPFSIEEVQAALGRYRQQSQRFSQMILLACKKPNFMQVLEAFHQAGVAYASKYPAPSPT